MRQTNSAIAMLLAQYRAIYRQAFYLGMATTIFVGSAVFSPYVFAEDANQLKEYYIAHEEITSQKDITEDKYHYDDVLIKDKGNLNVASQKAYTYSHVFINKNLDFEQGGKITVGAQGAQGQATVYLKDTNIKNADKATLDVKSHGRVEISKDNFIKLKEGKITLESDHLDSQANIDIYGADVVLSENDFSNDKNQKGIYQQGLLRGQNGSNTLTIEAKKSKSVDLTQNQFNKDKTEFAFQNIYLKGESAKVNNATLSVNNDLRVGVDTKGDVGELSGENLKLKFLHVNKDPKKVNVKSIDLSGESSITLNRGAWDFHNMDITVANSKTAFNVGSYAEAQDINNLLIKRGKAIVSGKLDTKKFELQDNATLDLTDGATFVITGTDQTDDLKFTDNNTITVKGGRLVLEQKVAEDIYDLKKKEFTDAGKKFAAKYNADASAILELAYEDHVKLDEKDIEIINKTFSNNKGYISLGKVEINSPTSLQGKTNWTTAQKYANVKLTNDELKNARISVTKDEYDSTHGVYGAFGSFDLNQDAVKDNTVELTKNTILSNAKGNSDGKSFIKVGSETANAKVIKDSSLTLANGGDIKNIELLEDSKLTVVGNDGDVTNILAIKSEQNKTTSTTFKGGNVNVEKGINTSTLSTTNTKVNVKEDINVNSFNSNNSDITVKQDINVNTLNTTNSNINVAKNINTSNFKATNSSYDVDGSITIGTSASLSNSKINANKIILKDDPNVGNIDFKITNGSNINLDEIDTKTHNAHTVLRIGEEAKKDANTKSLLRDVDSKVNNGSNAHVFIKNGSNFHRNVVIGSGETEYSSLVFADTNVSADAYVRDNSVLAYGFDSTAQLEKSLEDNFLKNANGSIKENKALLYLNKKVTIKDGASVSLNNAAKDDKLILNSNSAIVVTDNAIKDANGQAVINAEKKDFKVIVENPSKDDTHIILAGKFDAFNDKAEAIKIFGDTVALENDLKVKAAQGQLTGTIGKGSTSLDSLVVDKEAVAKVNYNVSYPVKSHVEKILSNEKGFTNEDFVKTETGKRVDDLAYALAGGTTIDTEGGKSLEQASRFALYGSTFKATDNAMKMQQDSLEGYINKAMAMSASNGELGSFFITPNVISSDVKDLDAEGLTYGTKGTLYGLTMGSSFIVRGDLQFGALASFGKGKYDGQGSANGIKNDYDFYGVGAFASFVNNNFSVTSDINYIRGKSEITADIIGSDTYKKFNADVDSSVLSLGINGAYKFNLDKVSLTPSLGIRYSTYDIDDYELRADNDVFMQNKFETMSVLSVPLALVLNSEFSDGSWVVNPSLSLGVTFNMGDKNVDNKSTIVSKYDGMNLTTQVLDKVVLGVRGGLKAQKDDLTMGFYVNYQGSNKTKDLGLSVDANYLF